MPKTIYTAQDIEDLVRHGTRSLSIADEDVVLTALAREAADKLGLKLLRGDAPAPAQPSLVNNEAAPRSSLTPANPLRFSPDASEPELRSAIVETGRLAYQNGLMVSNDGNISVRMADGRILITPSGICKGRMKPGDLLLIDAQGSLVKPAADPALKASSEQPMHLEVYRQRSDVRAVIHTHLIFANALAITLGKIRMDVIPEAVMSFGEIPITDFAMPSSTQNADAIRRLIVNHDVLLIRNHGSLTVGKNLDEALNHLERLEHVAKTLTVAELLGDVHPLPPEMLAAIAKISNTK
jgi:L-fuculose-phosphate aldolase